MSRTLRFPFAAAAVLALAVSASAAPAPPTARNVTLPYPAKAPVVLQVQGLERLKERLGKTLEALPPADADAVKKQLDGGLDQLLKGRKLNAVPKDGRVFVVAHDIAKLFGDDEPPVSVLVPVTSYKEFQGSFLTADERKSLEAGKGVDSLKTTAFGDERTLYLVDLKDYVAVTPSKETADTYAGKYTRALTGSMGPDVANSFLNADVALFVNMDVINDLYGDNIRQFKGLIDFGLMQAQAGGMLPGVNKKQMEMIKTVMKGMFQAVEDAQGVLLSVELRPEGLNLRAQVKFADESPSGKMLKAENPGPLAEVAALPKGMNGYTATRLGKTFTDIFLQFSAPFAGPDDDEALTAQIDKLLAELAAAGPQGDFGASSAPETTLSVSSYKDAAKAAAALAKLYKALPAAGKVSTVVLKTKPTVTDKAQSYKGFEFTQVNLSYDFEATVKDFPDNVRETTLAQFKRLAKEKTTLWIGTDGKVVVQVMAADWTAAKAVLDGYLDKGAGLGSDANYKLARKNLPADANMLMLFETGEMIISLIEQAKAVGDQIPGGLPAIGKVKPVKGDPTYIGVAVTLKAEVATADVFIPGTAMNVAAKMLAGLFKNIE